MDKDNNAGNVPWAIQTAREIEANAGRGKFCELTPVDEATVSPGIVPDTWFVFASGTAPCRNMSIQLVPVTYVDKPDFWVIRVIGCVPGACQEAIRSYSVWLDVTSHIGHKGIEIQGSNQTKKIAIP